MSTLIPVHHANALNFLQGKLPARDIRAAHAFLAGDLPRARSIIGDSKLARDDMAAPDHPLTTDIENLRNLLFTQLPNDVFVEVDETLTKMAADARELIKTVHIAANKDVIADGETDQPPTFAGRPTRGGAMDALHAGLYSDTRVNDTAHKNLRAHLARIGSV